MTDNLVIVGGGHAGVELASCLRRQGFEEPVMLLSAEPDLPYNRPPLSKTFFEDSTTAMLRPESFYSSNRIELRLGTRAVAIDLAARRLTVENGAGIAFSRLVLATGAKARRLPLIGGDAENVFLLRTLADAVALRESALAAGRIVVVGGGFVGLEIAATLAGHGKAVDILEMAPRVLARAVSPAVSEHVARRHAEFGVTLHTGIRVEALRRNGGRVDGVQLGDGRTIGADLVVIGAGAIAETQPAAAAGLADDNGIPVDSGLRTGADFVHAIGDSAEYPSARTGSRIRLESVQNATGQARHVARAMVGVETAYDDVPWFWSDQGDMKLQMAGLSAGADRRTIRGSPEAGRFSVWCYRDERLLGVDSVNDPGEHMIARKLLEAGISPGERDLQGEARDLLALARPGTAT